MVLVFAIPAGFLLYRAGILPPKFPVVLTAAQAHARSLGFDSDPAANQLDRSYAPTKGGTP